MPYLLTANNHDPGGSGGTNGGSPTSWVKMEDGTGVSPNNPAAGNGPVDFGRINNVGGGGGGISGTLPSKYSNYINTGLAAASASHSGLNNGGLMPHLGHHPSVPNFGLSNFASSITPSPLMSPASNSNYSHLNHGSRNGQHHLNLNLRSSPSMANNSHYNNASQVRD